MAFENAIKALDRRKQVLEINILHNEQDVNDYSAKTDATIKAIESDKKEIEEIDAARRLLDGAFD